MKLGAGCLVLVAVLFLAASLVAATLAAISR